VAGATQGRPILIDAAASGLGTSFPPPLEPVRETLKQSGLAGDAYQLNIHMAAIKRAVDKAQAS
jgi:carbon-monoxide dehydrogenase medium subunit